MQSLHAFGSSPDYSVSFPFFQSTAQLMGPITLASLTETINHYCIDIKYLCLPHHALIPGSILFAFAWVANHYRGFKQWLYVHALPHMEDQDDTTPIYGQCGQRTSAILCKEF